MTNDVRDDIQALEVRHYGKQPGSFELYEDDGKTFDYEKSDFTLRRLDFTGEIGRETFTKPGKPMFGPVGKWVKMTHYNMKLTYFTFAALWLVGGNGF